MMAVLGGIWKKFIDLLPRTPRYIGTVVTINSPGRYTVQLVGGGLLQVIGESNYQIPDRVFVADKKIEGKAPALTTETIEI
jgi:hypothetical protein